MSFSQAEKNQKTQRRGEKLYGEGGRTGGFGSFEEILNFAGWKETDGVPGPYGRQHSQANQKGQ